MREGPPNPPEVILAPAAPPTSTADRVYDFRVVFRGQKRVLHLSGDFKKVNKVKAQMFKSWNDMPGVSRIEDPNFQMSFLPTTGPETVIHQATLATVESGGFVELVGEDEIHILDTRRGKMNGHICLVSPGPSGFLVGFFKTL